MFHLSCVVLGKQMFAVYVQECLAAEVQQPMLASLQPFLEDKKLIAAQSATQQFQKLLDQFGGYQEHARWQDLQQRLTVFGGVLQKDDEQASAVEQTGNECHLQHCMFADSRVMTLQGISVAQKEVFAVGDLQHAVTVTANGRACEFSARQGVRLEVFVHRAVWLTGM